MAVEIGTSCFWIIGYVIREKVFHFLCVNSRNLSTVPTVPMFHHSYYMKLKFQSNKWEEQRQLKSEMMEDITNCLTTRRRNMKKQDQNDLVKTDW